MTKYAQFTTAIMEGGNYFMDSKLIKIIGMTATVIGMGATLVTEWVNDKKIDEKITKKVTEVLTKINEKES